MNKFSLTVISAVLALGGPAVTASESEPISRAQHEIVGEVVNVFTREVKEKWGVATNYIMEIRVAETVQGDGFRPGKVAYVHTWAYKLAPALPKDALVPGLPPWPSVPKQGEGVQAFLIQDADGRFRCLHNSQAIVPFTQRLSKNLPCP